MVYQSDSSSRPEQKGLVLRIEKTSIHDGQGLRTVVFLKGCPLHCWWCSTPESQNSALQRGYIRNNCRSCGSCAEKCPQGAIALAEGGGVKADPALCNGCFTCVFACVNDAVKGYGKWMSVQQVVTEINKDEVFYFHSGGGVTISGGECLQQAGFVSEILRECCQHGINTAIETSLCGSWENIAKILPFLSSIYVDIKHSDAVLHNRYVGVSNHRILENLHRIDSLKSSLPIHLRVPLIPGINDADEVLSAIAMMAAGLRNVKDLEILPYHRLGAGTYAHLSLPYKLQELALPDPEYIQERVEFLKGLQSGLPIKVGGGFQ